eukprot:4200321-Pleurochrysis_carterae.AAC.2
MIRQSACEVRPRGRCAYLRLGCQRREERRAPCCATSIPCSTGSLHETGKVGSTACRAWMDTKSGAIGGC